MATVDDYGDSTSSKHKLKSLLPKVLLYDNVSLAQRLNREITCISIEERKAAFTWTQIQRRFITDQAMKQEVHGMNLFPQINQTKSNPLFTNMPKRSQTMLEYSTTIPPICSPTTAVATANRIGEDDENEMAKKEANIDYLVEKHISRAEGLIRSRPPTLKRRRRTSNPLRDTRYVKLHRMLTQLPVNLESRLFIVN